MAEYGSRFARLGAALANMATRPRYRSKRRRGSQNVLKWLFGAMGVQSAIILGASSRWRAWVVEPPPRPALPDDHSRKLGARPDFLRDFPPITTMDRSTTPAITGWRAARAGISSGMWRKPLTGSRTVSEYSWSESEKTRSSDGSGPPNAWEGGALEAGSVVVSLQLTAIGPCQCGDPIRCRPEARASNDVDGTPVFSVARRPLGGRRP